MYLKYKIIVFYNLNILEIVFIILYNILFYCFCRYVEHRVTLHVWTVLVAVLVVVMMKANVTVVVWIAKEPVAVANNALDRSKHAEKELDKAMGVVEELFKQVETLYDYVSND